MKNKLFPFVFGRKGGAPMQILNDFEIGSFFDEAYVQLQQDIKTVKNDLVAILFSKIGNEEDDSIKNQFIHFKRDLFNNRNIEKYSNIIQNHISLQEKLVEYYGKKKELNIVQEKFNIDFNTALYKSINNLKLLTDNFFLKNGLLFSSKILFDEIQKNALSITSINKKDKRLIISLLKYLTRSLTKTTPYSSFNTIFCLQSNNDNFVTVKNEFKKSNLQITNLFYYYLKEILLKDLKFKNELIVRSNSTIWQEDNLKNKFYFFENKNNNEAFKKLNVSPILSFIKEQLELREIKYTSLVTSLELATSENKTIVQGFIDELIKEGFLKIIYPTLNTDKNWITNLIDFINQNNLNSTFIDVVNVLNYVLENIETLENTFNADTRHQIILESYKQITAFLTSRNYETEFLKKVQLQDVFYEDTFVSNDEVISIGIIESLSSEIKKAFHSLNNIPLKKAKRMWLGSHLTNNTKISILEFYEKIYLKNNESFIVNNTQLHESKIVFSKIKERIEEFNQALPDSIDISKYCKKIDNEYEKIPFGCYIQTNNKNFDTVVINNFSNGFGSNISRFLNFLPEEYSFNVIAYNEKLFPKTLIIEVKDASIHNVNTFPQLAKGFIHLCDDNIFKKTYKSISLSDIYINQDKDGDIYLTNQDDVVLQVINFSLEGINRRSKFVQFIDLFNNVDNFGYTYLLDKINNYFKENLLLNFDIVYVPRLKFGEKLIIQRKKWFVKKDFLTNLLDEKNKSLDEMFIKINILMKTNFIPDEVFFKIANRNSNNSQDDNYKPQYVNFKSPVFMLLLLNLINKADDIIEITEMFPTYNDVIINGGIVKEYIVNCN